MFYLSERFNTLSTDHQSYPKSRKPNAFEQNYTDSIINVTALVIANQSLENL